MDRITKMDIAHVSSAVTETLSTVLAALIYLYWFVVFHLALHYLNSLHRI